ncbi:TolC family protein, partial [Fusobacterium sp. SYSU M8D902]|uniref:TolC family protein n=1 Tax=Fusobacterium sp. SYSU M8D902 TaxID=3159562 RepID=UPI0032E379FE
MKIKSLIVFLILFLFGCSNNKPKDEKLVTVQEEREYLQKYGTSLSLDEVIEIARDRNLDLRIKRLETEIASLDRKIAFGNFLPSITLGANYTKLDDPINLEMGLPSLPPLPSALPLPPQVGGFLSKLPKSIETKLVDESFQTVGIAAQIPIFVPSTWYLYSARKKGEDISKLAESFADKMLQLQVMSEYFYILALESERETLINNLKSSEELERKAEVSLKVEGILDWELKKVQTLVESQKISLNKNERELKIAKMNLKRTLNLNLQEDIVLEKIDTKVVELP